MKLFGIAEDNDFKEYIKIAFQSQFEESVLEDWLENNPRSILEDGALLLIGRQIHTNLYSIIDLIGVDKQGNLAVVELKRDRTPRETLAQALEYASFMELLNYDQIEKIFQEYLSDENINLAQYHHEYFHLDESEAATFNKEQRIVIIGQVISPEIRQTASFLRKCGVRVTCIEFGFFETGDKQQLLSTDIVVGEEASKPNQVSSGSLPKTNKRQFLESADEYGKPVFTRLLDLAQQQNYPIHWGHKGFSLNVNHLGTHIAICFCYPPDSAYKQTLITSLYWAGGANSKLDIPAGVLQEVYDQTQASGLFVPSGQELKCMINHAFNSDQLEWLVSYINNLATLIKKYTRKGSAE
jgi:ACT domain-containing protein